MPISPTQLSQLLEDHWWPLVAWVGFEHPWSEDVVQEAFVKLTFVEPSPTDPVAWLFAVSHNLACNAHRASRRRTRLQESISHSSPKVTASTSTFDAEAREAIARLSPDESRVVVAHLWSGLSFEQIADMLNCPKTTAWRTYQRAIQRLQSLYQDHESETQ